MKMVKKILLGLVATAAVISFAGCAWSAGTGDTDGNKWDLTMTVDATDNASKKLETGKVFRRYWKQFSSSEKVAALTTTITIDPKNITYPESKPACVTGLIFDLNKNAADSSKVDFNLIGINPKTSKFYVERYVGIAKQGEELYDGTQDQSDIAIANGTTAVNLETGVTKSSGWCNLTSSMYSTNTDGVITCIVKITQENKKYSVYLGNVKVAEYDATASTNTSKIKNVEYAVGGIACYGNAGKGVKITANYKTEKDSVTGVLEAEEY